MPAATIRSGIPVIQFTLNSRSNQRWKFDKPRDSPYYMIISLRSKMCLTVKGDKTKPGATIVQEPPKNSNSQLWDLHHQGLTLYIIKSRLKEGLFLGIRRNSMNEGAELVLTNLEEYAFWRISGLS